MSIVLVHVKHKHPHMAGKQVAGKGKTLYLVHPETLDLHVTFGGDPYPEPGVYEHDAQEYRQFPKAFQVSSAQGSMDLPGGGMIRAGLDRAKAVVADLAATARPPAPRPAAPAAEPLPEEGDDLAENSPTVNLDFAEETSGGLGPERDLPEEDDKAAAPAAAPKPKAKVRAAPPPPPAPKS